MFILILVFCGICILFIVIVASQSSSGQRVVGGRRPQDDQSPDLHILHLDAPHDTSGAANDYVPNTTHSNYVSGDSQVDTASSLESGGQMGGGWVESDGSGFGSFDSGGSSDAGGGGSFDSGSN